MSTSVEMTSDGAITIEKKRFYVPAILRSVCPSCEVPYKRDLNDQYLSYPPCNVPFREHLYCGECDHEWDVDLRLDVRVTLSVPSPSEGKEK